MNVVEPIYGRASARSSKQERREIRPRHRSIECKRPFPRTADWEFHLIVLFSNENSGPFDHTTKFFDNLMNMKVVRTIECVSKLVILVGLLPIHIMHYIESLRWYAAASAASGEALFR